jgi:hypothetical protein
MFPPPTQGQRVELQTLLEAQRGTPELWGRNGMAGQVRRHTHQAARQGSGRQKPIRRRLAVLGAAAGTRSDETDTSGQLAEEAEKPVWTVWAILRDRGRDRGTSLGQ